MLYLPRSPSRRRTARSRAKGHLWLFRHRFSFPIAGSLQRHRRHFITFYALYIIFGGPNLVDFRHGRFLNTQLYKNQPYWDHAKIDHIGTRLGGTALSPGQPWDPARRRRAGPSSGPRGPRLARSNNCRFPHGRLLHIQDFNLTGS